jgi:hypothetical protein
MSKQPHFTSLAETSAMRSPRVPPRDYILRAVVSHAWAQLSHATPEQIAKQLWPDDPISPLHTKASTAPATTTTSGWASQLAATSVVDTLVGLGPASAASELVRRSINLEFGRNYALSIPTITQASTDLAFVVEGAALPVRALGLAGATVTPFRCGGIFTFTAELLRHSTPNAITLTRATLNESLGAALDSIMLDANAATSSRPAGLRNGAASVSPTAGGGDAAMARDLGLLAAAVSGVGGLGICFVAHPDEVLKIILRASGEFLSRFPVLPSNALSDHTVMAIALPALAIVANPVPRIEEADQATLHMEGASPAAFSTSGTPNVISAPIRGLWQSDSVGVKLVMEISWALRAAASAAVATVASVTW